MQTAGIGRVGMAQDLVKSGVELPALMTAGRWKSAKMLARYSERQATDRGAVARYYEESGEQNCLRPSCHRLRTKLAQEPPRAEVINGATPHTEANTTKFLFSRTSRKFTANSVARKEKLQAPTTLHQAG